MADLARSLAGSLFFYAILNRDPNHKIGKILNPRKRTVQTLFLLNFKTIIEEELALLLINCKTRKIIRNFLEYLLSLIKDVKRPTAYGGLRLLTANYG